MSDKTFELLFFGGLLTFSWGLTAFLAWWALAFDLDAGGGAIVGAAVSVVLTFAIFAKD